MKKELLILALLASAVVCSAEDPPFHRAFGQPADLRRTTLDLRVVTVTNVVYPVSMRLTNGWTDVLGLPIRIENRSAKIITAKIAHEWFGGIWPPTDLSAAAKRAEAPSARWRASEVYLVGELGSITESSVWQPGQSQEFLLRMNWPGTGSCPAQPLIDAKTPGKYLVRVLLIFKVNDTLEYFESPEMEIRVAEKPPDK